MPAELSSQFDALPNQKNQLLEHVATVFYGGKASAEEPVDPKTLHAKIAQLSLESDFL